MSIELHPLGNISETLERGKVPLSKKKTCIAITRTKKAGLQCLGFRVQAACLLLTPAPQQGWLFPRVMRSKCERVGRFPPGNSVV